MNQNPEQRARDIIDEKLRASGWLIQDKSKINLSAGALPNISQGILKNLKIAFPHISEQQKIVEEIESRLSVANKVEETISQSLQQAETLRQSILKQAFEGKLV